MVKLLKYLVKHILINLGKAIGFFLSDGGGSTLFFFFPFYHIGGAEKVHADVVACVSDQKPCVFFTDKSQNRKFKPSFEKNARVLDISSLTGHRITYYACLGVLAGFLNHSAATAVFGCNSPFFYELIPHLRKSIRRIDLLHAFGERIEYTSLPVVHEINVRVVVNSKVMLDLKNLYTLHGIDPTMAEQIQVIENQVAVPNDYPGKDSDGRLHVLYVGRGTKEKRVHLVGRAAAHCRRTGMLAEFTLVGDVAEAVQVEDRDCCVFKGEIANADELAELYQQANVLVLTSSREGFPIVVMEAMAQGAVPVCTDVGGLSVHVKHGVNGMLIPDGNEEAIVGSLVRIVGQLAADRMLLRQLSHNAYEYARAHFGPLRFRSAYRQLLLSQPALDQR